MEHRAAIVFLLSVHLLLLQLSTIHGQSLPIVDDDMQTYIIDVERHEDHELLTDEYLESWHASFLPNSTLDSGAPRHLYSYRHVLSGFAARLTLRELEEIKSMPGFLHAQRSRDYHLHTTYTPRYLGLTVKDGWGSTMMGETVIIGIIDTGIKPDHPSFNGSSMPTSPPATKWKGNCSYTGFACNEKIIGAKGFKNGANPSPLDVQGHGTHVASIAAGSFVKNANVLGMAKGTSSGMAPMAYLSIYKACHPPKVKCQDVDIYAAIDQAIKDGVDIISMSFGGLNDEKLYEDSVARASMAAIKNNIVCVTAAGNNGPNLGTLSHSAPWLLTVGASTTDRRVESNVVLGGVTKFAGESAYQPKTWNSSNPLPLEYPGENGDVNLRCCEPTAMAKLNLSGKIVICESACDVTDLERGEAAYKVGAEGMIIISHPYKGYTTYAEAHVLPVAYVSYPAGLEIATYYLKQKSNATAAIHFNGTQFGFKPSPAVPAFSSRGPSVTNGRLIKPDVLAPGANILAAWPKAVGPNPKPLASHTFNFLSGTSMAAPHVSGIAALIRAKHRGWTPSEIVSAIVTTADDSAGTIVDEISNEAAGIYAMGAGEVNPARALDPGLVFGQTVDDYFLYLCGLGYDDLQVYQIMALRKSCSGTKKLEAMNLNYPSIGLHLSDRQKSKTVVRTAKNVVNGSEEYTAKITQPPGVDMFLSTYTLKFTRLDQEESYEIRFDLTGTGSSELIRRGKIVWESAKHTVTTPIAVNVL